MITNEALNAKKLPFLEIIIAQQLVLLPLYFFIPFWITLLNLCSAGLILWSNAKTRFVLPRWAKVVITVIAIAGIFFVFRKISGKDAGTSLIAAMYGLKILETNKKRDAILILNLGFFILVGGFLFAQSPIMAVYQFVPILAILYALSRLNQIGGDKEKSFRNLLKSLTATLIIALPIMVMMFIFFPRLSGPLWRMPGATSAVSGVGDSMSPGDVSNLQLFDKIAFRARFESNSPKPSNLYWRVIVLDEFDGLTWTRGGASPINSQQSAENLDDKIDYTISMEPSRQNFLVTLDRAISSPKRTMLLEDRVVYSRYRVLDRTRYSMSSIPSLSLNQDGLSQFERARFTKIPKDGNLRSKNWAIQKRSEVESDFEYLQSILQHINQESFYYTLQPPILSQDIIDSFWLDYQRGFCEHYAAALVYLSRAAGIPARVVIGYQGGEKNPLSDYWIVRYANAHAWTEVWMEGQGWVRVDPTAAIAPHRIESSLLSEYSQREGIFDSFDAVDLGELSVFKQMEYWIDEMNNSWNEWIIDFNSERQRQLFTSFGFGGISNQQMIVIMFTGAFLFMGIFSFKHFHRQKQQDELATAYEKLEKYILKRFLNREEQNLGPLALRQRITALQLDDEESVKALIDEYIKVRYRRTSNTRSEEKMLASKIRRFLRFS